MARFEMTLSAGDKVLVDHAAAGMPELLAELTANAFVLYDEVSAASATAPRPVIVASSQIVMIRLLDGLSTQSTTFRPKR